MTDSKTFTADQLRNLGFAGLVDLIRDNGESDPDSENAVFIMVNGDKANLMTSGLELTGEIIVGTAARANFCDTIEQVIEAIEDVDGFAGIEG